jgi:predicted nucleotidyltransferase
MAMRLSSKIRDLLKSCIGEHFGEVKIYLFGSRTDETKSGGDIDLAIQSDLPAEEFRAKKYQVMASLIRAGFDLKIDLVQYPNPDELLTAEISSAKIEL